jgi:hypothetical protein
VFTPTGKVSGSLSSRWRTKHLGTCSTGRLSWTAH